jgi:hypothetical protein
MALQIGHTQVQLPLEPTPNVVLQVSLAIKLVDPLTLRCDWQQQNLVRTRC